MKYHDRKYCVYKRLEDSPRLFCLVSGAFFILSASTGCHAKNPSEAKDLASRAFLVEGKHRVIPEDSPLRSRLKVIPVNASSIQRHLNVPATVQPDPARFAKVAPPLSGRVTTVHVSLGDTVAKGQALFSLDSPDLISAQSEYLKTVSSRSQAERVLVRQKDLRAHGIAAEREVEQAQTDLDLADRELHRAGLQLRLLGSNTNSIGKPMVVRAPIHGRVVEFKIAQGEMLNDVSAAVMTIADLSEVWIIANVQEMDVRRIHVGQAAAISMAAYPEERFDGRVHVIGDILNPETRTLSVTLVFKNSDDRLKPGMFGTVDFLSESVHALLVDTSAVVLTGRDNQVFVEVTPWHFEARTVQLDTSVGNKAIVLSGLTAGERIVVQDAVVLQ
jgi:cobalt-zinc-cadmium efflux system membrane fusion protein